MLEDIKFLITVYKTKRTLRRINKKLEKIQDIICESNHTIEDVLDAMEVHHD